jgi:hypothetical protein
MSETPNRRLLWSAWLIVAGLVIEIISLFGLKHPWGFLLFTGGCALMVVGILLYLSHKMGTKA